jgi:hypothetical protein
VSQDGLVPIRRYLRMAELEPSQPGQKDHFQDSMKPLAMIGLDPEQVSANACERPVAGIADQKQTCPTQGGHETTLPICDQGEEYAPGRL